VPEADDAALLAILGADMSGALQALPTDDNPPAPPLRASAERAPLAGYRASLGGMQLKFSANFKDHVTLPAHGETGQWILKLPPRDQPTLPALEATAMEWARAVGFQVPEVRVVASALIEGLPDDILSQVATALLVRRFDRPDDRLRVHMEEVNSALGFHPVEKYPGEGSPDDSRRPTTHTATSIGRVFRRFALAQAAATFVQRWVFDALVGNGDAHLKNWAFVFPDGRRGAIAPVYDVVPTVLRGDATSAIRELAKKLSLDPDVVEADARSLVDRAMATFAEAAEPFSLGDEARRWRQHQEDVARAWT
jgi:serine/threonine-protein kinase HipA